MRLRVYGDRRGGKKGVCGGGGGKRLLRDWECRKGRIRGGVREEEEEEEQVSRPQQHVEILDDPRPGLAINMLCLARALIGREAAMFSSAACCSSDRLCRTPLACIDSFVISFCWPFHLQSRSGRHRRRWRDMTSYFTHVRRAGFQKLLAWQTAKPV